MPTVNNFSAWIEVDGKQLPEYGVHSSANGGQLIRTCWIPSEAGKEFKIVYQDTLRELNTGTRVHVDGVRCIGYLLAKTELFTVPYRCTGQGMQRSRNPLDTTRKAVHDGVCTSATTYKPYVFSNCQLTEDEGIIGPVTASLGEIVVDVEQVEVKGIAPWSNPQLPTDLPPLNIHERAKKGIVHGTQLGREVPAPATFSVASGIAIRKLVSFRFKYRPLDVLKADGIIPQDKPTPAKRQADPEDIIDLTVEDDCPHCQCGARSRKKARVTKSVVKTEVKKENFVTFGDGDLI